MSTINIDQAIDRAVMTLCNASGELRQCQRDLLPLRELPADLRRREARCLLTLCRLNRQQQRAASATLHALYGFGGAV